MHTQWRDAARRTFGDGAGDADRFGVRAGARRSRSGDAGAATRSRRDAVVAGRPRLRCKSTRRQRAGADASTDSATDARTSTMRRAGGIFPRRSGADARRSNPRVSRPLRRRPDRVRARNGVRRPMRIRRSKCSACDGRQPARLAALFAEELGAVLQVARARRGEWCVQRFAAVGLGACVHDIGAPQAAASRRRSKRRHDACSMPTPRRCNVVGPRRAIGCSGCATIPPARTKSSRALLPTIRACVRSSRLRRPTTWWRRT